MGRLATWLMTRANCCVIGIGCCCIPVAVAAVGGVVGWQVLT